jgi:hypothetical protein
MQERTMTLFTADSSMETIRDEISRVLTEMAADGQDADDASRELVKIAIFLSLKHAGAVETLSGLVALGNQLSKELPAAWLCVRARQSAAGSA